MLGESPETDCGLPTAVVPLPTETLEVTVPTEATLQDAPRLVVLYIYHAVVAEPLGFTELFSVADELLGDDAGLVVTLGGGGPLSVTPVTGAYELGLPDAS